MGPAAPKELPKVKYVESLVKSVSKEEMRGKVLVSLKGLPKVKYVKRSR